MHLARDRTLATVNNEMTYRNRNGDCCNEEGMALKRSIADRVAGGIFIIMGIIALIEGWRLYPMRTRAIVGDEAFPLVIGFVMVGLGGILTISPMQAKKRVTWPKGKQAVPWFSSKYFFRRCGTFLYNWPLPMVWVSAFFDCPNICLLCGVHFLAKDAVSYRRLRFVSGLRSC
jgi:hypothetical protein